MIDRSNPAGVNATLAALAAATLAAAAPAHGATPLRSEPIVLSAESAPSLLGRAPERLVAFRIKRARFARNDRWARVPVQVDERKYVDFGSAPPNNSVPGVEGTVYGTAPIGVGAVQYADPHTFVGADGDPAIDADDEIALMADDAGRRARKRSGRPPGVRSGKPVRVGLLDPLTGEARHVYLFEASAPQPPPADYVAYELEIAGGEYRSTYRRADGPNPETSTISTPVYEAGFSDRWYYDELRVPAGGGADFLDGFKFSFGPSSCGRSEATFNAAEGAFVANLDGPVRAIRSYVGANSGPLTQRTHLFYRDRHEIVTDLRVHAVPGPMTYHELSLAGIGMSYSSSESPAVTVDGAGDAVGDAPADWHMWSGAPGTLFAADRIESSYLDSLNAGASTWYLDDATPGFPQCWGDPDGQALGQAGLRSTAAMPNTDPRIGGTDYMRATTTEIVSGPDGGPEEAARWAAQLAEPLSVALERTRR